MDVINDKFLWDGAKALANERKHGITFMFATKALQDGLADISYVRLISARRATLRERREYESGEYSVRESGMTDGYNVIPMIGTEAVKVVDDYDDGMKAEYDFSNGVRGALRDCRLPMPIDNEVLWHFHARARVTGIDSTEAINEILRAHVGLPPRTAPPSSLRSIHENLRRHFGLPPRPVKPPASPDVAKRR